MITTYTLPSSHAADLDKFQEQAELFTSGKISATQFRAFRVPQGVYEQRQDGTFMIRVRLPGGLIVPHQMRKLAEVARRYGSGRLHITTRQDVQVHDVAVEDLHPALVELSPAGLSSKGGGGNTVRNITACADAGVCVKEVFDVSPHVVSVTEFMLSDPVSYQLPRKYKIAFSGCSQDCIGAVVNDLGFVAVEGKDGPGFAVYAGGGMGPHACVGQLLESFVPVGDVHLVAEAVKRVFDKHGNRKNRQQARLRYLVEQKGFGVFADLYRGELAELRKESPRAPKLRDAPTRSEARSVDTIVPGDGFEAWREANVVEQKQSGYYMVHVPIFLGDLPPETFEKLADVADAYGEGAVRATPSQSLVLRWVGEEELPGLHRELSGLGLAEAMPPVLREMIACTGAATCRLGMCLSQGLADVSREALRQADLDLDAATDLRLYINGCPNSCGRHAVASIGLVGAARRVNERLTPHYIVQLGGRVGVDRTKLARGKAMVPARNVPAFLVELLRAFRAAGEYPDFNAYLDNGGSNAAAGIVAKHRDIPQFDEDERYYRDWGCDEPFSLAGRGAGECSAGVFDLIRVDLASAHQALDEGRLLPATTLAARAMLVTQGEEAKDGLGALELFAKHFLDAGHVDSAFGDLIVRARRSLVSPDGEGQFEAGVDEVTGLIAAVESLYENMDQSLRFQTSPGRAGEEKAASAETAGPTGVDEIKVDREADFQGVTCPLNYVKTKMLLQQMKTGQILSVLLDEAGGLSVPRSAEKDGHEILLESVEGERWRVVIRKG